MTTIEDPTRTEAGLAGIDFPILLFDGSCGFCNGSVQWVAPRDRTGTLHFAPLESEIGRFLLSEQGIPWGDTDSVVLVTDGKAYLRSTAASQVARLLGFPWWIGGYLLLLIPRFLRDWAYDVVARNRYRIAGTVDTCMVPDPKWAARVLG